MRNAAAAKDYFAKTDMLATCPGEWLGKGGKMLGLEGDANQMHFWSMADNLHPQTGEQLTTYTRDNRRVGLDMTFNAVKSVSLARELAGENNAGDARIETAHREAVKYTVDLLEKEMQARVRVGGKGDRKLDNRTTGNLVAYRVTHRDTRVNADDGMPDPALHDHVFVFNATFDFVEQKWKAAEIGQIKHDAPFYEAVYANRLARNLKELSYGIERKGKYYEITGVSQELKDKFSRRTKYIEQVAAKLGIEKPESKAKLGATTRLGKVKEVADDLNSYYAGRLTLEEKQQLATLQGKPSREVTTEQSVAYAIGHEFERRSVVDEKRLYETALRYGVGCVTPEGIQAEAKRQGLLTKNREATTKAVLAEEQKVIAFARDGRGTCRPLRPTSSIPNGRPHVEREASSEAGRGLDHHTVIPRVRPDLDTATGSPGQQVVSEREIGVGSGADVSAQLFGERVERSQQASPPYPSQAAAARSDTATVLEAGQQKARPGSQVEAGAPLELRRDEAEGRRNGPPNNTRIMAGMQSDIATPTGEPQAVSTPRLSAEQTVMVNHVLTSPDRVMLVIGDAGTGKTFAVKSAFQRIGRPVDIIAPSADASRGVLRREGFKNADTVTGFLGDRDRQATVKNGVIWVDEAGMLPMRDLSRLVDVAKEQNARLVLQGDPKQHRAVARDGNMMRVLESHAGLPVARLKDIRRQKDQYKQAVAALADGRIKDGFKTLLDLEWIKQTPVFDHNQPLVDDYLAAIHANKEVLAIAPTHAEADEVTGAIRTGLKARGMLGEEHTVQTLRPLHFTEAEKGDLERYTGNEVLQFHRNGGTFKAGDKVAIAELKKTDRLGKPSTFAVYTPGEISLAEGDRIRITANGWTADRKHRLDNGGQYQIAGFEKDGKIRLTNGWFIAADFKHLQHGYVTTSHAAQGKTVDRVLIAMGHESLPAINREQFYVSVSRGRESATIYTSVAPIILRDQILRADTRRSATEVFGKRRREWWLSRRARAMWQSLRGRMMSDKPEQTKQRELRHER